MMIVKKMDPLSLAKIQGMMGVIFGFIAGIIIGIVTSIMGSMLKATMAGVEGGANNLSTIGMFGSLGWIAVFVLPIIYGVLFFILGLISAWIYNLIAKMVGGMKMELEYEKVETTIIQQPLQQPVQKPVQQQMRK